MQSQISSLIGDGKTGIWSLTPDLRQAKGNTKVQEDRIIQGISQTRSGHHTVRANIKNLEHELTKDHRISSGTSRYELAETDRPSGFKYPQTNYNKQRSGEHTKWRELKQREEVGGQSQKHMDISTQTVT